MTSFEQVQRRLLDSLVANERRIFMQLIGDELPTMTLRELGEILTGPAARCVADLPVQALFAAAAPSEPAEPAAARRPPRAPAASRRRRQSPAEGRAEAPAANRRSAGRAAEPRAPDATTAGPPPAPSPAPEATPARTDESVHARKDMSSNREPADAAPGPRPAPATSAPTIELAPSPSGRSNVAIIQSIVSRTLARHHRQDPDAQVLTALRAVGDWIRARDLRGRVELQPDELRASLNRLVKAGAVQRGGEGPDTVYLPSGGAAGASGSGSSPMGGWTGSPPAE